MIAAAWDWLCANPLVAIGFAALVCAIVAFFLLNPPRELSVEEGADPRPYRADQTGRRR